MHVMLVHAWVHVGLTPLPNHFDLSKLTYSLIWLSHVIIMVSMIYRDIDLYDELQDIVNVVKC